MDWTRRFWVVAFCLQLAIFPSSMSYAQDNMMTVTGTVTDAATGKTMAGVIVTAYNDTHYSAMTDEKGYYELKVPTYTRSVTMRIEGYNILQKAIANVVF